MATTAKVICDSISESGQRIITLVLEYPRIIHSEFNTHRMFSRNASSSRAIPVSVAAKRVKEDGFVPSYLGKNQKGMQAYSEVSDEVRELILTEWNINKNNAVNAAEWLDKMGVHKQLANRLLEPFNYIQVVVTATEWGNFFAQRLHPAAQPEIQELAIVMKEVMDSSNPRILKAGEWHLPFVDIEKEKSLFYKEWRAKEIVESRMNLGTVEEMLRQVSVARCARVSYGLNDRGWGEYEKDLALYDMLITNQHWSPTEHQATPNSYHPQKVFRFDWSNGITHMDKEGLLWSGNFKGWVQNRQLIQQSQ